MQQRLPIPLPKVKFGSPRDSEEEADEDVATATPSQGDSEDGDPEVPSSSTQSLADQIRALTTRFDANWDKSQEHCVSLSQDMDALKAEMAFIRSNQDRITQQLTQLLSFHTPSPQRFSRTYLCSLISLSVIEDTVSFQLGGVGVRFGLGLFFCLF